MLIEAKLQDQQRYHDLMVEAKVRMTAINTFTGDQRGIPSQIIREFDILQIRMLCEIIGLACLVAHGDLIDQAQGNLRKEFKPGQIFDALEDLHDDFFPVPGTLKKTETGWHFDYWEGGPFATKEELTTIWARSGDVLHRGSLKNLIKAKAPVENQFAEVVEWGQKISNLLQAHRIITVGREWAFVSMLRNEAEEVQVVAVRAEPPAKEAVIAAANDAAGADNEIEL